MTRTISSWVGHQSPGCLLGVGGGRVGENEEFGGWGKGNEGIPSVLFGKEKRGVYKVDRLVREQFHKCT